MQCKAGKCTWKELDKSNKGFTESRGEPTEELKLTWRVASFKGGLAGTENLGIATKKPPLPPPFYLLLID